MSARKEKKRFQCLSCKYPFSRYEKPPACPYCSKPTVTDVVYEQAEELLRDVSE